MSESQSPAESLAKSDQNLVWMDCEMSGLDPQKERLLEIAVVITGPHLQPRIEGPVLVIHQSQALLDGMDAWNKGTHGKSGLIDKVKASTLTEAQAEQQLLEFIGRYVPRSASVRQHHQPGSALSGALYAAARGLDALPQSGCQHAQGTGQALEA
jgi:oligoribonuclease